MIGQAVLERSRYRTWLCSSVLLVLMAALSITISAPKLAVAQSPNNAFKARSYVNPFPQTDRYHLHVLGDYLATGLASGLSEAFDKEGTIKIINSTKANAGLARPERTNWPTDIADLEKSQPIHIAVIMMGINDVRNIRTEKGVVRWGTEEWRDAYADQIDQLIKALKAKNIAVYWVGLPVMSNAKTSEAMALINDILRERSYINGTKYIDSWSGFTDQFGGFTAYGPDLTGQNKRLREPDGISFTARGNRKLANYIEVLLRRDLAAARGERNISLAGDEEEQARLVPQKADSGWSAEGQPEGESSPVPAENATVDGTEGQAPAIVGVTPPPSANIGPQPVLSVFASGYAPPGETITGDTSIGVTGLATVSPLNDLNANLGDRRLPVTERLYYKSLVEGEALKPKPGRADDFRWPRG